MAKVLVEATTDGLSGKRRFPGDKFEVEVDPKVKTASWYKPVGASHVSVTVPEIPGVTDGPRPRGKFSGK